MSNDKIMMAWNTAEMVARISAEIPIGRSVPYQMIADAFNHNFSHLFDTATVSEERAGGYHKTFVRSGDIQLAYSLQRHPSLE